MCKYTAMVGQATLATQEALRRVLRSTQVPTYRPGTSGAGATRYGGAADCLTEEQIAEFKEVRLKCGFRLRADGSMARCQTG